MGFDLNALATQTAVEKVDFMGQTATVMYNPSLLTHQGIADAQGGDDAFVEFFCDLVKDWDVKNGTKKVPLNRKGLEGVPLPFLKKVFVSIVQSQGGPDVEEEGKASPAGSRSKAKQGTRRTGTS